MYYSFCKVILNLKCNLNVDKKEKKNDKRLIKDSKIKRN